MCRRLGSAVGHPTMRPAASTCAPITLPVALSMIGPAESMIESAFSAICSRLPGAVVVIGVTGPAPLTSLGSAIHLPLTSCFHSTFPTASLSIWFFSLARASVMF